MDGRGSTGVNLPSAICPSAHQVQSLLSASPGCTFVARHAGSAGAGGQSDEQHERAGAGQDSGVAGETPKRSDETLPPTAIAIVRPAAVPTPALRSPSARIMPRSFRSAHRGPRARRTRATAGPVVRDDAVEADRREEQRDGAEDDEERRAELPGSHEWIHQVLKRSHVGIRQVGGASSAYCSQPRPARQARHSPSRGPAASRQGRRRVLHERRVEQERSRVLEALAPGVADDPDDLRAGEQHASSSFT